MTNIAALAEYAGDITIKNNEDWIDAVAYADPVTHAPIALDGIAIAMTVRPSIGDPSVLFFATLDNRQIQVLPITVGGVNSVWAVVVYAATFSPFLPPGSYVYGVQATADGMTKTLLSGNLIVLQGVA